MKRLLLITNDVIGDTAAGPGIRYRELASRLVEKGYPVTVLGTQPAFSTPPPFRYGSLTAVQLIRSLRSCDAVIIRGGGPLVTSLVLLFGYRKELIADLYAFTHLEVPHLSGASLMQRSVVEVRKLFHLEKLLLYGKFFDKYWVANYRQQDFLQGILFSAQSAETGKEITIVPFGYPSERPQKRRRVLRGVVPGIGEDDFIVIWGGGVWDWLDPITLVRAMARLVDKEPKIKLYFMGTKAPAGYIPEKARGLLRLSEELGLLNRSVFINPGWTAYNERTDYLLEADAGVSLHPLSLETRYSFRTRNLDYVHCGLPMLHTEGDVWADMIAQYSLGIVVPPGDEQAVSDAILRLSENTQLRISLRNNVERFYSRFTWNAITKTAIESLERPVVQRQRRFLVVVLTCLLRYTVFGIRSCFALSKVIVGRNRDSSSKRSLTE